MDSAGPLLGIDYALLTSYERDLPHWRQDGAVYFVTFRLKDSIPRRVMEMWQQDRFEWLARHGITGEMAASERTRRYQQIPMRVRRAFERDQARRFFIELDQCHGECVLRDSRISRIVGDAMTHYHGTRVRCGDFVIMPNHVHWLLQTLAGHDLETALASVKRWSAREINRLNGKHGALWQRESYDRIVRDADEYSRTREYIKANPSQARLQPGEYRYHRADL